MLTGPPAGMRVIGARQVTRDDLVFKSSDEMTVLRFSPGDRGQLQVDIDGNWLWLGPEDIKRLRRWLSS